MGCSRSWHDPGQGSFFGLEEGLTAGDRLQTALSAVEGVSPSFLKGRPSNQHSASWVGELRVLQSKEDHSLGFLPPYRGHPGLLSCCISSCSPFIIPAGSPPTVLPSLPFRFPSLFPARVTQVFKVLKANPIWWASASLQASGTALIEVEGQGTPPSGHCGLAIKLCNL